MISVIIPVFNCEKYLAECLASVKQVSDIEIIVVNDGSNDNSEQVAKEYTDKVINITHSGPVVARNIGLANACGDYVIFIDADDILTKNAISIMQNEIGDFDGIIGLRSDFVSPDCPNIATKLTTSGHGVIAGCAMFKKSAFECAGNFDSDLMCGDGYEWLIRAKKAGLVIKEIDSVLCLRRIHNTNMGKTMANQEKIDYAKIIRKHFVGK